MEKLEKRLLGKLLILMSILIPILIYIDQYTKYSAITFLNSQSQDEYPVTSFLNIILTLNTGISFGLFNNNEEINVVIFSILSISISCFIFYIFCQHVKEKGQSFNKMFLVSVILILSGALSNVIDRILISGVIDFIDFHIYDYHYPAFNVADSFIVIGSFLMFLHFIKNDLKTTK